MTVPVSWGIPSGSGGSVYGLTSSVRFWAGYSWQDNTGGTGAVRPTVKLKLDKPNYHAGDKVKLNVTAPQAVKAMCFWNPVTVRCGGRKWMCRKAAPMWKSR